MKRKLDAARIEEARRTTIKSDTIDEWLRVQDIFGAGRRGKKKADVIRKKFEFPRAKAGMLRGYYYLDPDWSREERDQFFTVMDAIINSADQQNEN